MDLVLLEQGRVEVHSGSDRSKKGDDLVEPAARFTLALTGDGSGHADRPAGGGADERDEDASGGDEVADGDAGDVGDQADGGPDMSSADFRREGVPRFLDLDGDGRDEIVIRGGWGGRGRIVVFTIPRSAPAH